VLVLGHLGNTLDAFAQVRASGADGVEFDVRRATDGSLVVHHDPLPPVVPADAPSLAAALAVCAGMVANVELKNLPIDPDYDPTEEIVSLALSALDELGWPAEHLIVSSFSLATIDACRRGNPTVATAFLTLPRWDQARAIAAAAANGHGALHPHVRSLDEALVDAAHDAGLTIHPWAVDDVATARKALELGVDAIITDDPVAVLPVVR
jgi:glycerophosphoryl diester phosphodiesterase